MHNKQPERQNKNRNINISQYAYDNLKNIWREKNNMSKSTIFSSWVKKNKS